MGNKAWASLAFVLALVFIAIGYVYVSRPAGMLPAFFPGYRAGATAAHLKHGLASFIVAAACLIFGWFKTGLRQST